MTDQIETKLQQLGIKLPEPAAPAANYVPFTRCGNQLFISGQLPMENGALAITGKLGADVSIEQGQRAAKLCAINILAQVKAATGSLEAIVKCLKLGGFVNATPDFTDHPAVINGASDLIGDVLGEKGAHARFAVGAGGLPFNAAVEIDAVFEILAG